MVALVLDPLSGFLHLKFSQLCRYHWFGAPAFFVTVSLNAGKDVYLATWISHRAGVDGERVRVWHVASEKRELRLLPGRARPLDRGAYFTHKPVQSPDRASCPYHEMCARETIELYRQRLVPELLSFPLTDSSPRYKEAFSSPAWLHTVSRMFDRHVKKITEHVLTHPSSGLDVDFHTRITEFQSNTGLPHVHTVGYKHLSTRVDNLLGRMQGGHFLTEVELQPLLELAVGAVTASTTAADLLDQFPGLSAALAARAAEMAKKYQVHVHCTESCVPDSLNTDQTCRFFFPRLPSLFPILARCPELKTDDQKTALLSVERLHRKVQGELRWYQSRETPEFLDTPGGLVKLLHKAADGRPQELPQAPGVFLWALILFEPSPELDTMMEKCRQFSPDSEDDRRTLALYHCTLKHRRNAKFRPRRKVSEAYVECFNPVLLVAADGNVSVDMIGHTVQNLFGYCTKGGSSRFGILDVANEVRTRRTAEAFRAADDLDERYGKWREVTIGEALHGLDSDLRLSVSNFEVAWVNTSLPGRLDCGEETEDADDGNYVATTADMRRYGMRPDTLERLSLAQFLMWYRLSKPGREEAEPRFDQAVDICSPDDLPPAAGHTVMPGKLTLEDGTVLRLRRLPRALNWGPKSTYASILLFSVRIPARLVLSARYLHNLVPFRPGETRGEISAPTRIRTEPRSSTPGRTWRGGPVTVESRWWS